MVMLPNGVIKNIVNENSVQSIYPISTSVLLSRSDILYDSQYSDILSPVISKKMGWFNRDVAPMFTHWCILFALNH